MTLTFDGQCQISFPMDGYIEAQVKTMQYYQLSVAKPRRTTNTKNEKKQFELSRDN